MSTINDEFLAGLGLGALPPATRDALKQHVHETLQVRVGTRLASVMSGAQLDAFNELAEAGDEAGALQALEDVAPDYREVVANEFGRLRDEIAEVAPAILWDALRTTTPANADSRVPEAPRPADADRPAPEAARPADTDQRMPEATRPADADPRDLAPAHPACPVSASGATTDALPIPTLVGGRIAAVLDGLGLVATVTDGQIIGGDDRGPVCAFATLGEPGVPRALLCRSFVGLFTWSTGLTQTLTALTERLLHIGHLASEPYEGDTHLVFVEHCLSIDELDRTTLHAATFLLNAGADTVRDHHAAGTGDDTPDVDPATATATATAATTEEEAA